MLKLLLLLFPMSVWATDYSIPHDLKKSPAFIGVCNDPTCNYKKPVITSKNAAFMVGKEHGIEYAILVAVGIGIGEQLLTGNLDANELGRSTVNRLLYYRFEF